MPDEYADFTPISYTYVEYGVVVTSKGGLHGSILSKEEAERIGVDYEPLYRLVRSSELQ